MNKSDLTQKYQSQDLPSAVVDLINFLSPNGSSVTAKGTRYQKILNDSEGVANYSFTNFSLLSIETLSGTPTITTNDADGTYNEQLTIDDAPITFQGGLISSVNISLPIGAQVKILQVK